MSSRYMLIAVRDKAARVGTAVRADHKAPPAVVLHCWGSGDPSVGIPEYREDFIVQPTYAPVTTELLEALRDMLFEFIDIGPKVTVCPGPQACPVCNPGCEECGGRNGKHLRGCSVKHYGPKGKGRT